MSIYTTKRTANSSFNHNDCYSGFPFSQDFPRCCYSNLFITYHLDLVASRLTNLQVDGFSFGAWLVAIVWTDHRLYRGHGPWSRSVAGQTRQYVTGDEEGSNDLKSIIQSSVIQTRFIGTAGAVRDGFVFNTKTSSLTRKIDYPFTW